MHSGIHAQPLPIQWVEHLFPSGQSLSESHTLNWSNGPSNNESKVQIEMAHSFTYINIQHIQLKINVYSKS